MSALRDLLLANETTLAEVVELLRSIERKSEGGLDDAAAAAARELGAPLAGIESALSKHGKGLSNLLGALLTAVQKPPDRPMQVHLDPAVLAAMQSAKNAAPAFGWEFEVTEHFADGNIKKLIARPRES